jgi:tetratricopeptide (TPR) repeat protein
MKVMSLWKIWRDFSIWVMALLLLGGLFSHPMDAFANEAKELYEKGNTLFEQRKFREAADYYERAIKFKNNFAPLYYNLAEAQKELGSYSEAIDNYREYLRLSPGTREAKTALSRIQELESKKMDTKSSNTITEITANQIIGIWLSTDDRSGFMSLYKFYPDGTANFTFWGGKPITWKLLGRRMEMVYTSYSEWHWYAEVNGEKMKGFRNYGNTYYKDIPWELTKLADDVNAIIPLYYLCSYGNYFKCVNVSVTSSLCNLAAPAQYSSSLTLQECMDKCRRAFPEGNESCVDQ